MSPVALGPIVYSRELESLLGAAVASGDLTAGAAIVGSTSGPRFSAVAGVRRAAGRSRPTTASLFDLASLSKLFAASLGVRLQARDRLPLSAALGEIWPDLRGSRARVRLGSLLRHEGGFAPWYPLYVEGLTPTDLVRGRFGRRRLPTYSDLGVMVWAGSVEKALGEPLFKLLRQEVLAPLDLLRDVQQAPPDLRRAVECRLGNEREQQLAADLGLTVGKRRASVGEAQDGNAHWLGGFPGHAGLFGSARAVWRLAAEWTAPTVFDESSVSEALAGDGIYRLGWWAADDGRFWHPGFTGCYVTIDRRERWVEVLLAHRTSHQVSLDDLRERLREVR